MKFENENQGISKGILVAVAVGGVACAVAMSVIITILMTRRYAGNHRAMSRKRLCKLLNMLFELFFQ